MDHATTTTFARIKVAKVGPERRRAENIAISARSAIYSASTNMVGRANRTYICTSGFKPSVNINNSALSSGT